MLKKIGLIFGLSFIFYAPSSFTVFKTLYVAHPKGNSTGPAIYIYGDKHLAPHPVTRQINTEKNLKKKIIQDDQLQMLICLLRENNRQHPYSYLIESFLKRHQYYFGQDSSPTISLLNDIYKSLVIRKADAEYPALISKVENVDFRIHSCFALQIFKKAEPLKTESKECLKTQAYLIDVFEEIELMIQKTNSLLKMALGETYEKRKAGEIIKRISDDFIAFKEYIVDYAKVPKNQTLVNLVELWWSKSPAMARSESEHCYQLLDKVINPLFALYLFARTLMEYNENNNVVICVGGKHADDLKRLLSQYGFCTHQAYKIPKIGVDAYQYFTRPYNADFKCACMHEQ